MRMTALVFALVLLVAGPAVAQEWEEYVNTQDGFKVLFPGQPKVAETTWTSQLNYILPARVYSVDKGHEHYSVTVVDYSGIEQLGIERSKTCRARERELSANRSTRPRCRVLRGTMSEGRSCMRHTSSFNGTPS